MKKLETSYNPTATRILETPRSKSLELEEVSTTAEAGREEYGVSNILDVSHYLIDIANVMTNKIHTNVGNGIRPSSRSLQTWKRGRYGRR